MLIEGMPYLPVPVDIAAGRFLRVVGDGVKSSVLSSLVIDSKRGGTLLSEGEMSEGLFRPTVFVESPSDDIMCIISIMPLSGHCKKLSGAWGESSITVLIFY